jgi:hypothetical protein
MFSFMSDHNTTPDNTKSPDNFDRLLKHLKNGSLAARLVRAYHSAGTAGPGDSMMLVLKERLEEVKKSFEDKN